MNKENIYYKVVGLRNRRGSNFNLIFCQPNVDQTFKEWKKINHLLWEKLKDYFPTYKKGSIIKSVKNSPGIMCFENLCDVDSFINREKFKDHEVKYKIIRIRGIGFGNRRPFIISSCGTDVKRVTEKFNDMISPPGTISFDSIEVLD